MQLTINPEYEDLVPALSESQYNSLSDSIKENGLWMPILTNPEGIILDGHHRFKICKELGINLKHAVRNFDSKTDEIIFVGECNLKRRHLEPLQRIALVRKLEPYYQKKAKENSLSNLKQNEPSGKFFPLGRIREVLGDKAGVSDRTYEKGVKILDTGNQDLIQKIINKNDSIDSTYRVIQKDKKRQKRHEEIKKIQVNLPDTVTLYNQDFQTAPIPESSVSLIFTDPPYGEESLPLVRDLCFHAMKVLKDGGSLVFYPGHAHIDKVFEYAKEAGLTYHWIIAVTHSGPSSSIFGRKVLAAYKPMLWFTKGRYEGEFVKDLIKSEFQGKELHEWAQSTKESDYYIKYMTIQNEIVYDPFLGSGVFGVSARKLKRQFIGCEINKDHFETARRLISSAIN